MTSLLKMHSKSSGFAKGHVRLTLLLGLLTSNETSFSGEAFPRIPEAYFQYVTVPGKNEYYFGFSRGNRNHHITRYEHATDCNVNTKVLWADEHRGSGQHYWEYSHIAKGKRNCEHNIYGSKGYVREDYGLLQEIHGRLKGSYGSTPSDHEGEGNSHINVAGGNFILGGGHALGGEHNAPGGGHIFLGGGHVAQGGGHVVLGGRHVVLRGGHVNLGSSYKDISDGIVGLANSHTKVGGSHMNLEDSHSSLEGSHVKLSESLNNSSVDPGHLHGILSSSYGGFSGSNSILGSLGSIYRNLAVSYANLKRGLAYNAPTYKLLVGELKGGTVVLTDTTSEEISPNADWNNILSRLTEDHGHSGEGGSSGAHIRSSESTNAEVQHRDQSTTDQHNTHNHESGNKGIYDNDDHNDDNENDNESKIDN